MIVHMTCVHWCDISGQLVTKSCWGDNYQTGLCCTNRFNASGYVNYDWCDICCNIWIFFWFLKALRGLVITVQHQARLCFQCVWISHWCVWLVVMVVWMMKFGHRQWLTIHTHTANTKTSKCQSSPNALVSDNIVQTTVKLAKIQAESLLMSKEG